MKMLINRKGKMFLWKGEDIHTKYGVISAKKVKKAKEGKIIRTQLGEEFLLCEARTNDFLRRMKKGAQVIYPKDLGLIVGITSLGNGDCLVDAGTGSASLAIFMANVVGRKGKVITFEKRKDFAEIAKKNIERSGLEKRIEFHNKDFLKARIKEKADVVTLDMEEAEKGVAKAKKILRPGGFCVVYTTRIDDLKKNVDALKENGFIDIWSVESSMRKVRVEKSIRIGGMYGYVGYLSFGRKFK